ncbi:MAG: hypothetical protein JO180_09375 [Gemmatirosa sp.]|nr:hypothetical protein [Gemmatirosa sp.]
MLPDPLHPAIVHFPVVLAVLLPIFAAGSLWAIRRGTTPRRAWAVPVALSVALALSAWVAVQTGQAQDERVERVVAEQPLETHEEAAELFLLLSAGMALLAGAGLARGRIGQAARGLATVGAAVLVGVVVQVGHSGGQLVYRYGAASAYTGARRQGPSPAATSAGEHRVPAVAARRKGDD